MIMIFPGRKTRERLWATWMLAVLLPAAPALAQPVGNASAPAKISLRFTTIVFEIPIGTRWLEIEDGYCLAPWVTNTSNGDRHVEPPGPFIDSFKSEMENAGYKVTAVEDNLFGQEEGAADFQVAAVVSDLHVNACMYRQGGFGISPGDARGNSSMTVKWQVYSPLKKEVVARVTTSGTGNLEKSVANGLDRLEPLAFASSTHALAASAEFRAAMNAPRPARDELLTPTKNDPIALSGSLKAGKRTIADATGSVVTILTGSGSGSGVLVSDDGFMLTDAHVVGDEKEVRVRWSDSLETVAQVIRVAKDRDVALIKTSARDRAPLALKRGAVTPGQRVFAIGSPKSKDFQGTVSSGVISADRIVNGLRYIQSDVTVSHGSSGGPLLDGNAAVIGFTDLGIDNDGPAGLNLFTPIGDAMDFLNLQQK